MLALCVTSTFFPGASLIHMFLPELNCANLVCALKPKENLQCTTEMSLQLQRFLNINETHLNLANSLLKLIRLFKTTNYSFKRLQCERSY